MPVSRYHQLFHILKDSFPTFLVQVLRKVAVQVVMMLVLFVLCCQFAHGLVFCPQFNGVHFVNALDYAICLFMVSSKALLDPQKQFFEIFYLVTGQGVNGTGEGVHIQIPRLHNLCL